MAESNGKKRALVVIDSDDDEPKQTRSEILPDRYQHHQQSTALIATWLIEARPSLTEQETAKLMDFISIQHPGIHPHNIMRHLGITAFLEQAEANGTMPSEHALMALGNIARVRSESADAEVAGQKDARADQQFFPPQIYCRIR